MTKLDLGLAWNDAVALLRANLRVVLVVAGVFFFLPNVVAAVAMPQPAELEAMASSPDLAENMDAFMEMLTAYYQSIWWVFALIALLQAVGMLGLLALLTDASRPTVGQALAFGARALVPYIVAQLLASLIMVMVVVLLVAVGAAINVALAVVLGLVALVLAVYLWVKFSLVSPVIAIEKVMNPLRAIMRSWQLTKGNSLRLFFFYFLLVLVAVVIFIVASMVFSIFALAGDEAGLFASAVGGSLVQMGVLIAFIGVLAAVHRQLAGGSAPAVRETFD
ncbi:glycerophosphoryl diester phosphodiesterase membrane domain-containing protein [Aurantiacibacter luteus]|uniref:Glycerophosphoryl diester phosphodiesterase membrane domain-containing protein n=1 Tax=Aurantiacibacter luteus TaxID=1581420 RepID=A0A0G9MSR6_9SPHN|nr:glycerophosphoryl diester phosphodiesterase membrane domain-containing protein [Aurantiacibacter luteus]KLE32353.1 hypothetical protein AAW00_12945 [Aurantiacibacter luteus]